MIYHSLSICIKFISFLLGYLFYSKFFFICFLQFIFIKHSNNIFTIEIIDNLCSWNNIYNFFDYKNSFRPIWSISFSKSVFLFWYSYMITNLKFRIIIIFLLPKLIYILSLTFISKRLHFNSLWYVLLYLLTISSRYHLSIYTFFISKSCVSRF